MSETNCKLTVFFEDPFWVGVYERWENSVCSACKIVFGAEPKDVEVWEYLLTGFARLRFSPAVSDFRRSERPLNPKRMQRAVKRELAHSGTGTKAQEALKLQQEAGKKARKKRTREQKEAKQERQFQLHRQKQKARHKGR